MSKLDNLYPTLQKREAYMADLGQQAQRLVKDQMNGIDTSAEFAEVLRRQSVTQMGSKLLSQLALKPSKIVTDEAR
jgi:hypothetical protein